MNEYVTAYVIDNYNFDIYQKEICMSKNGILDAVNFHMIGSQIRLVNGRPYKIICEMYLKEGYTYFPTTIIGQKPDIVGSIIVTGIDEYGDSVSLTEEDLIALKEFTTLRAYNKDGILKAIYTLEVENPLGTNIQTDNPSKIQHLRRLF